MEGFPTSKELREEAIRPHFLEALDKPINRVWKAAISVCGSNEKLLLMMNTLTSMATVSTSSHHDDRVRTLRFMAQKTQQILRSVENDF